MNKQKRAETIAQEYSETSVTVLELASNYRMSVAEIIKILSARLGDQYRELVQLKRQQNQGANTMSDNFFHVNDKVQWTNSEGVKTIGVISKLFKSKCWLEPAGADRVGETIKGVPLEEIELYSSEPGPIEVAIADLKAQANEIEKPTAAVEQPQETEKPEQYKVGDYVVFHDGESAQTLIGEIKRLLNSGNYLIFADGQSWSVEPSAIKPDASEAITNDESQEFIENLETHPEPNCRSRQFSPGDRVEFLDDPDENGYQQKLVGTVKGLKKDGNYWVMFDGQDWDIPPDEMTLIQPEEPAEAESEEVEEVEENPNCQDRQLSDWKPGDRVKFFDEDTDQWILGEIESLEEDSDYCTVSTPAGEICFIFASQLEPAEEDSENNCQDRQLSESDESVESDNCQSQQFDEIPDDGDSETFWLPLEAIAEHPDFQPRGLSWQTQDKGIDSDVVAQYCDWLEFSEPPALEIWHGEIDGSEEYWLLAGHHRIRALSKAGRESVECFQWAQSYEEAVYRSSISNAGGGNRTRQIHKMKRAEWGEACKQFLRICDRLSPEAIHEFLNEAAALTGQTKKWSKLNDTAISAVFGVGRTTVGEYRKEIEMERFAEKFPLGTRVLLVNYSEIFLLEKREYRLGVVDVFNPTKGVLVKFDSCRAKNGYFHPNDLKVVDDPLPEQHFFKIGDKVWNEQPGVVVAISPDENSKPNLWSVYLDITEVTPLVCWDDGYHQVVERMDYDGSGETLSVEQRLTKLSSYLDSIKDDSSQNWKISNAKDQIKYLQSLVNPQEVQPETTTVKQEEKQKRQEVLGRSTPAGDGGFSGSELPDMSGVNGKHPEDPQTTVVGALERPPVATNLERAKLEARRSAALSAANNLKVDLPVLYDAELEEIINAAEAELNRRRLSEDLSSPEVFNEENHVLIN